MKKKIEPFHFQGLSAVISACLFMKDLEKLYIYIYLHYITLHYIYNIKVTVVRSVIDPNVPRNLSYI